jgi:uncharacterized membrane protein YhaH (DUF805 family)
MDQGQISFALLVSTMTFSVIFAIIMLIPYVMIIRKAGYSGWWSLIIFVPLVNLIMLWVFAFSRWPIEERAAGVGIEKVF